MKWLYPAEMSAAAASNASSEKPAVAKDGSVDRFDEDENSTTEAHGPGKNIGTASTSEDATTTGGPDSDVGSVDELPIENGTADGEGGKKGVLLRSSLFVLFFLKLWHQSLSRYDTDQSNRRDN